MSFILDALRSLLDRLLFSFGLQGKEGSIVMLGLDNAGKTTLLYRLKTGGDIRPFPPTDRPSQEKFTLGRISFQTWDLGGHEAVRHLWEDYISTQVSAIIFMVDASDRDRLEEASYELDALIGEGLVAGIPIAILFNKCDLPNALPSEEICQRLDYDRLLVEQQQHTKQRKEKDNEGSIDAPMAIFRISVLQGEGYEEAFQWVGRFL